MIETNIHRHEFADGEELAQGLAAWTAERLSAAITARGVALLIVSGGKSPARFFELLSDMALDWTRVHVTLADEPVASASSGGRQSLCGIGCVGVAKPL